MRGVLQNQIILEYFRIEPHDFFGDPQLFKKTLGPLASHGLQEISPAPLGTSSAWQAWVDSAFLVILQLRKSQSIHLDFIDFTAEY